MVLTSWRTSATSEQKASRMPNIFKRISDVLAANLNDLIDRVEDPERMVKQIIREMEDNIRIAEEGVIEAMASEKQLHTQNRHPMATRL
jgi:phage shock protein A